MVVYQTDIGLNLPPTELHANGSFAKGSHCVARAAAYDGHSYPLHSSISAEELSDHRMHFHGLFLLDLLIGSENDTNSQ